MHSIRKNYFFNLVYQILTILLPIITTPYISRVLGVEKVGLNSYLGSVETYFIIFAALGTAFYGKREVARLRDNKHELSETFWEIELLSIITTSICLVVWLLFSSAQAYYRELYYILSLNILAIAFDISWLFAGLELFDKIVYKNLVVKVISLILLFTCVKTSDDVNVYILISSCGAFLGNISLWIRLNEYVCQPRIKLSNLSKHFMATIVYFLPTIATTIYTVLDKTMLQIITTDYDQNGYYEQAVKLCRMPMTILLSLDTVMGARMSYLVEKNRREEIRKRLEQSIKLVFLIGIPMVIGIDLIIDRMVPWFLGRGYTPVTSLVYLYSPLIMCVGINNCLSEQFLTPIGKRKQTAIIVVISALMNFVLNVLLIPRFEAAGASVASVFSEAFIAIAYIMFTKNIIPISFYFKYSYKNVIAAVVMFVFTYTITIKLRSSIMCTMIQIIIGAMVYICCLIILNDNFIKEIVRIIFRKRGDRF